MKTLGLGKIAALGALAVLPGCAMTCGATPEKLANLKRGMSYAEVSGVMGCAGTPAGPRANQPDEVWTVEWAGPGTVVTATELDFRGDQLLYYETKVRGGL